MAGKLVRRCDRPSEEEGRSETVSDIRLLRAQRMASAKSGCTIASERRPGLSHAAPRLGIDQKGSKNPRTIRCNLKPRSSHPPSELLRTRRLCKIALIPNEASAKVPVVPDHEVLRVIGRGAYGEIWLARTLTGALRAVKIVYRSTFETERAFRREFEGMSSFEPISRAHAGFIDILHVGRTREYLYYSMELADDHVAGRQINPTNYEPRTLKSDLARQKRLTADESIRLGILLTESLDALHARGLTHRDIKLSNIIFTEGV